MIFWDASAIIPLCVEEPFTRTTRSILKDDPSMAVWWGSVPECRSAFARLRRRGAMDAEDEEQALGLLTLLSDRWTEILPGNDLRDLAGRILAVHPLSAADALQLAAALVWCGKNPGGRRFACLDLKLRDAARKEGFKLLPEKMP